jgi:hypothetical protein
VQFVTLETSPNSPFSLDAVGVMLINDVTSSMLQPLRADRGIRLKECVDL